MGHTAYIPDWLWKRLQAERRRRPGVTIAGILAEWAERPRALERWEKTLEQRERALERRERALEARERALEARERDLERQRQSLSLEKTIWEVAKRLDRQPSPEALRKARRQVLGPLGKLGGGVRDL